MLASKEKKKQKQENTTRQVWKSPPRKQTVSRTRAKMHKLRKEKYPNPSKPILCSIQQSPNASTSSAGALVRALLLCSVDTVTSTDTLIWKILLKTSQLFVVAACWHIKAYSYKQHVHSPVVMWLKPYIPCLH